jgi:transcriptional regulator with XRE-family HTH domain
MNSFSVFIKNIRLKNNMSLRRIQKESGLPINYLEELEIQFENPPSLEILLKLCPAYNISVQKTLKNCK